MYDKIGCPFKVVRTTLLPFKPYSWLLIGKFNPEVFVIKSASVEKNCGLKRKKHIF
jgi:hypothetical protein